MIPPRKAMSEAGADADEEVAQRRGPREARINVDQGRALFPSPSWASGSRRGGPRPCSAHDQDAVAVGQVLLVIGGRAAAERGAQTGHRGAVSYPRLVLDRHHAQAAAEQLLIR